MPCECVDCIGTPVIRAKYGQAAVWAKSDRPTDSFDCNRWRAKVPQGCAVLKPERIDWRFPPSRSRELVDALTRAGKSVSYANIESPHGHDAFLLPEPRYQALFSAFMGRVAREQHIDAAGAEEIR